MMRYFKFALTGLFLLCSAPLVHAHPHAWITMNADIRFDKTGKIAGLYIEWDFDPDYSQIAVEGLDANADGYYSADELAPLTKANLTALKEYDYFTYARNRNAKLAWGKPAEDVQYYANGHLRMSFYIPLKTPLDPKTNIFNFKMYDPSFYIAMDFRKKNPVTASGKIPAGCKIDIKPVPSDKEIDKTRKMLSQKDKKWQPAVEEDFGAMFAQPVIVRCTDKTAQK